MVKVGATKVRFLGIGSYRSFGTFRECNAFSRQTGIAEVEATVDGLIYLIGLIVVIMAILSFFGLR
jgi:hypothetical protein